MKKLEIGSRLRVEVTLSDIALARCLDPHSCMVRLAFYRHFRDVLKRPVESMRVRGNGMTVTMRLADGSAETEWWSVPTNAYNKICLFDEADAAIRARPDRKLNILSALGVKPFKFSTHLIRRKVTKPAGSERQARIEENRRARLAYWKRRERREPGVTPPGYFSGVRRRYASTITPPRPEAIAKAVREATI